MIKSPFCASLALLVSAVPSMDAYSQHFAIVGASTEYVTAEQIRRWGFTVEVSEPDPEGLTHVRVYVPNEIAGQFYTNAYTWLKGSGGTRILSFRPETQTDPSSQSSFVELVGRTSTLVCMRFYASFSAPPEENVFTSHRARRSVVLEIHDYLDVENQDCNVSWFQALGAPE